MVNVFSISLRNIQYLAGADGIIFHPVGFPDFVNFDFMRFGDGIQRISGFHGIFYKRPGTGGNGNVGGNGIVDDFGGLLGNDIDQLVQFLLPGGLVIFDLLIQFKNLFDEFLIALLQRLIAFYQILAAQIEVGDLTLNPVNAAGVSGGVILKLFHVPGKLLIRAAVITGTGGQFAEFDLLFRFRRIKHGASAHQQSG